MTELAPAACPSGHRWGPPVDGTVLFKTGWHPCACPGAEGLGGHRSYFCERPDCPTPWVYAGGHDPSYDQHHPYGNG